MSSWRDFPWEWLGVLLGRAPQREASGQRSCEHPGETQLHEVAQRYAAGITWVGNTMSTVGYGYIGPCSTDERIFAIISMITACATFAIIVGSLQKVPLRLLCRIVLG